MHFSSKNSLHLNGLYFLFNQAYFYSSSINIKFILNQYFVFKDNTVIVRLCSLGVDFAEDFDFSSYIDIQNIPYPCNLTGSQAKFENLRLKRGPMKVSINEQSE